MFFMSITLEKTKQVSSILGELEIDLWLLFVRETAMQSDPSLSLVLEHGVTWPSFFMYPRSGKNQALVGNFDQENFIKSGHFSKVKCYTAGVKEDFLKVITELDPKQIAINYSASNPAADGLTHGMFTLLCGYLSGTPYSGRLISSEQFLSKLRSRKLPIEQKLLEQAALMAGNVWRETNPQIEIGMTEIEVAALIDRAIVKTGGTPSFDTIVNAGDKSKPGHALPSKAKLAAGDLLHVDFGVKYEDYCSDLQRLLYFKRPGEETAPPELSEAFDTIVEIIERTGQSCCPGVKGYEIDALARGILNERGYPEYQHALGHQLGRDVHDGGSLIGPKWDRYGITPTIPLERDNVFTLELEIMLPGIGCVGLEEDMIVTDNGARFLCPAQKELIVK